MNDYDLLWWDLAPYVHLEPHNHTEQLTGFIYNIFLDSVARCLGGDSMSHDEVIRSFKPHQMASQGELLESIVKLPAAGMPVILEASALPDAPASFIRVLSTIGLTWMYHHDPPQDNVILKGLASVWPILCIVIIFTGYAALFIWLAERSTKSNRYFHRRFHRGILDSYWYAFVSATTVGYGDKVPQSVVGKLLSIAWMLCGICAISVFTAAIATFFSSLTETRAVVPPPMHNVKVGVLNSSIDFRLVAERGGQPVEFSTVEELMEGVENHLVDSIAIDPNVYCLVHEDLNKTFEFRVGATSPTVVGYLFNVQNTSLLECMRTSAFYQQNEFNHHLKELYQKVERQEDVQADMQQNMFGADGGGFYIGLAAAGLLVLYAIAFSIDVIVARCQRSKRAQRNSSDGRQQHTLLYCNGDDAKAVEV